MGLWLLSVFLQKFAFWFKRILSIGRSIQSHHVFVDYFRLMRFGVAREINKNVPARCRRQGKYSVKKDYGLFVFLQLNFYLGEGPEGFIILRL